MTRAFQTSQSEHSPELPEEGRVPGFAYLISSVWSMLALGFGTGLVPLWPGTVGSIVGIGLAWPLRWAPPSFQFVTILAAFGLGTWVCQRAGRELANPDCSAIVWDEIVGMAAVALAAPGGLIWTFTGFLAFRAFDILKPWPIGLIDRRLRNGLGVMLDDALAAAYAIAAIWAAALLIQHISG